MISVERRVAVAAGPEHLELHVEELRPEGFPLDDPPPEIPWSPAPPPPGHLRADGRPPNEARAPNETRIADRTQIADETRTMTSDDRPATIRGGGGDIPVLLLHGIAGSTADWAAVVPELATSRRVIAYDQRGHGASGWATTGRAGYSFDQLVADLATVVDVLGLPAVHLIGHSMGGVVALRYTLNHPGRVRSLVLADTAAAPATGTGGITKRVVSVLLAGAAAIATAVHAGRNRAVAGLGRMDPNAIVALWRDLSSYPSLTDRLGEICAPTTVIVGERDFSLRDAAETLARSVPDAHLAVIAGADHNPHASRPIAWLTAVEDHLTRADQIATDLIR
ncbi:putative hydrolase or acyltransferase of alpha/beta superfamily [Frankia casuarinae]|nr:putative hydrolase or acyltransferase of alpha/beta superfamily [Frankia sp. CcI6]EYT91467.1 putative hydrolase or acyltransferase of alpha/beta superfamily [Frankia casuarinae]OAA21805.1 putative hydrolase or acyltransferase of alpha/beta superfamily [Frankia casuarinae]